MSAVAVVVRAGCALLGVWIIASVLLSAVRTVIVPRGERVVLTSFVFIGGRALLRPFLSRSGPARRERLLQRYAPLALLTLAFSWVLLVGTGFALIYWAIGGLSWEDSFLLSGSAITTLGFAGARHTDQFISVFEAIIGLGIVGLLITFLPTMYAAYNRREVMVAQLHSRAGTPPTVFRFVSRLHAIRGLDDLEDLWTEWEAFFAELEESHTSYPALMYFRSSIGRSWLTASGTLLDSAAMITAAVDVERLSSANLCIRSGFLALNSLASYVRLPIPEDPRPDDPISVSRAEFDEVFDQLLDGGVPMRDDREQAWRDWAGWRVNYDAALVGLCGIVQPPVVPWSSDRSTPANQPLLRTLWAVRVANR